MDTAHAEALAT